jgi:hypothetical protein
VRNWLRQKPGPPPPAALRQVADHIDEIIGAGTHTQRKALIGALVANVKITGPGRAVPVFRIPQATGAEHLDGSGEVSGVRALTNLVGLTCRHPNPPVLAHGPELMIRAVREPERRLWDGAAVTRTALRRLR